MRFISPNFTRLKCLDCNAVTVINPSKVFYGLNCNCNIEVSSPIMEEKDYIAQDGKVVTSIGVFKNGDVEVCYQSDMTQTYRIPKATFKTFKEAEPITEKPLDKMKKDELKVIAEGLGVDKPWLLKKDELIEKIKEVRND